MKWPWSRGKITTWSPSSWRERRALQQPEWPDLAAAAAAVGRLGASPPLVFAGEARNLREGAPVALSILDPDNPYRYIQIRGAVKRCVEEGADQHIDSLAKKYLGKDKYPFAQPGEVRVMYEIEPRAANAMG